MNNSHSLVNGRTLTRDVSASSNLGLSPLALSPSTSRLVFIVAAGLAVTLILGLGRNLSFIGDEWDYIALRQLTLASMLQPHNEHLVFLHVLVYRGLVEMLGTTSYLPFMGVLMVCHVWMAASVYALMRRAVPVEGALGSAVLILFLGSGFDNLLWAFQMGFVAAAALGVLSLAAAHRPAVCAALLTLSLWTHGDGLFFVAPVALLITQRRWLLIPIGSYAIWFAAFGRSGVALADMGASFEYATRLTGSIVGGVAGVGAMAGLFVLALILGGLAARRSAPPRFAVAGLVGLASEIAILTFGRAHFGVDQAEAPRYIYVATPFVLMSLTGIRGVPRPAWAAVLAIAIALNIWALPRGVAIYETFLTYDRSLTLDQRLEPFRPPTADHP